MIVSHRISRRHVFARFGPAAVFALAAMRSARALAQAADKKGKFIAFHTTSGFVLDPFWDGINTGTLRANNFAGKSLEPLSDYAAVRSCFAMWATETLAPASLAKATRTIWKHFSADRPSGFQRRHQRQPQPPGLCNGCVTQRSAVSSAPTKERHSGEKLSRPLISGTHQGSSPC